MKMTKRNWVLMFCLAAVQLGFSVGYSCRSYNRMIERDIVWNNAMNAGCCVYEGGIVYTGKHSAELCPPCPTKDWP